MRFEEFNLHEALMQGIREAGFEEAMPVQEAAFTHTLKRKDLFVQSQTGSGKTAAFLIPIFQIMLENPDRKMRALVVAPTRELASQIEKEAKILGKYLPFTSGVFYGGVGYAHQEKLLKQGVDIIIGTPGRLIDFNQMGKLEFGDVNILVIDEADRLFDMGFLPDLKKIIRKMPPKNERQTMLFSATLDYEVRRIAYEYMNEPEQIELSRDHVAVETIAQKLYHVGSQDKMRLLLGILKSENPNNAIIFTNTKRAAHEVAKRLEVNGIRCEYIMGDLPQSKRLQVIDSIKSGELKFLVATDVASRGLHINDLELVVNYDLPENTESYVHRIGRTGRVGKEGRAVSLVCEKYVYGLEAIEAYTKVKIPVEWADESLYAEDASKGMRFYLDRDGRGDRGDRGGRRDSRGGRDRGRGRDGRDSRGDRGRRPGERHGEREKREAHEARRAQQQGEAAPAREVREQREKPHHAPAAARAAHAPSHGRGQAGNQPRPESGDRKRKRRRRGKKGGGEGQDQAQQAQQPQAPRVDHSRKMPKKASMDQRLEYYSNKYGENFYMDGESASVKKGKKESLVKKVLGIFKKKKD
ncbi:MAG: DEAD/DEAH box helicase [Spirochaetes bacterium]|nr:DEAD/DEAH box helicase [Spirochaetota bacterium]